MNINAINPNITTNSHKKFYNIKVSKNDNTYYGNPENKNSMFFPSAIKYANLSYTNNISFKGKDNTSGTPLDIFLKTARGLLIDDVKRSGEPSANGICFYGPDSIGKEKALDGFIQDLSNADYKIVHLPRAKDADVEEIRRIADQSIREAETHFKNTNQRTAIIVRDLDQIAPDLEIEPVRNATRALLQTENCQEKGFAWISEAVDIGKVDYALRRPGRMEHRIPVKPDPDDPKEIWDAYVETIKKYGSVQHKDWLLDDAIKSMPEKFQIKVNNSVENGVFHLENEVIRQFDKQIKMLSLLSESYLDNKINIQDAKSMKLLGDFIDDKLTSLISNRQFEPTSLWTKSQKIGDKNLADFWLSLIGKDTKNMTPEQKTEKIKKFSEEEKSQIIKGSLEEYINVVFPNELRKGNHTNLSILQENNNAVLSKLNSLRRNKNIEPIANTKIGDVPLTDYWIDELEGAGKSLNYTQRLKNKRIQQILDDPQKTSKLIQKTLGSIEKSNSSIKTTKESFKNILDEEDELTPEQKELLIQYQDSELFYSVITNNIASDDIIKLEINVIQTVKQLAKEKETVRLNSLNNIFMPLYNSSVLNSDNPEEQEKINFIFNLLKNKCQNSDPVSIELLQQRISAFEDSRNSDTEGFDKSWKALVQEAQEYYETKILDDLTSRNIELLYSMNTHLQGETNPVILDAIANPRLTKIEQKEFISRYRQDKNLILMLNNPNVNLPEAIDSFLYFEAVNKQCIQRSLNLFEPAISESNIADFKSMADKYLEKLGKKPSIMSTSDKLKILQNIAPEELKIIRETILRDWEQNELTAFISNKFLETEQEYDINAQGKNIAAGLYETNNLLSNQTQIISKFAGDITALEFAQVQQLIDINKQLKEIGKSTTNIEVYTRAIARTQLVELQKNKYYKDVVPEITKLLPEDEQIDLETFLKKVDECAKKENNAQRRKKIMQAALVVAGVAAAGTATFYFGPAIVAHLASGLPPAAAPILASTLSQANIIKQTGTTALIDNPSFGTRTAEEAIGTLKSIRTSDADSAAEYIRQNYSRIGDSEVRNIVSKHINLKAKYDAAERARKLAAGKK